MALLKGQRKEEAHRPQVELGIQELPFDDEHLYAGKIREMKTDHVM